MKELTVGIVISFLMINFCLGQDTSSKDFFEIGFKSGKFLESSFLENSRYHGELSDPNEELVGFTASPTGKIYSTKLRYGKKVFKNGHLIAELGYSKLQEQVNCFCHICDKVSIPTTLVKLNAINAGIGTRYQILKIKRFDLSIEGIASFSFLINEPDVKYFGYSIHPFVGYQLSENININLKYGYEASFKNYEKREKYFELAINHAIGRKVG